MCRRGRRVLQGDMSGGCGSGGGEGGDGRRWEGGKRRGRERGRDELQGGVQHVAQRDHEEGVCAGGTLRGGGECRVSGKGGSVQQESGQLVDDVGEGGEGECGIVLGWPHGGVRTRSRSGSDCPPLHNDRMQLHCSACGAQSLHCMAHTGEAEQPTAVTVRAQLSQLTSQPPGAGLQAGCCSAGCAVQLGVSHTPGTAAMNDVSASAVTTILT